MSKDVEQKIIDYLTVEIMNDSKFVCNPHIRVRCAWIEAKKVFDKLNENQKNNILHSINRNCRDFHLPDFCD
jgi:hypothetical protein